jgi:hypothetical protein
MHFDKFAFGSLQIDGSTYEHDIVIDPQRNPQTQAETLQGVPR